MVETEKQNLGTTDTGIKPNVAALLAYLLGFVSGLVLILIEKNNKFVRFHAMQSIVVFGVIFASIKVGSILRVSGSESTAIGVAP